MLDCKAVGVTDHVVMEHHAAERASSAQRGLQRILGAFARLLGAHLDLNVDLFVVRFVEASIVPMAVRAQHRGQLSRTPRGHVEIAGDVVAGQAREINLLDDVAIPFHFAMDDRVERRLRRHRPQALRHEELLAHHFAALVPRLQIVGRRPWEIAIVIGRLVESAIARASCANDDAVNARRTRIDRRRMAKTP